jgi:hypothetical protein
MSKVIKFQTNQAVAGVFDGSCKTSSTGCAAVTFAASPVAFSDFPSLLLP